MGDREREGGLRITELARISVILPQQRGPALSPSSEISLSMYWDKARRMAGNAGRATGGPLYVLEHAGFPQEGEREARGEL